MKVFICLEETAGGVNVTAQSDNLIVGADGKPIMTPFLDLCQQLTAMTHKFVAAYTAAHGKQIPEA